MQPSPRFLTEPRIWLNSSPSHEPQAGTGFRQGELSFFWTPWGNLCDAGVRSNSYDPFQDTWREGDEYDVSRYKGKVHFFSETGPSTLSCCSEWSSRANAPLFAPHLQVNFRESFLERRAVLFPPPSESVASVGKDGIRKVQRSPSGLKGGGATWGFLAVQSPVFRENSIIRSPSNVKNASNRFPSSMAGSQNRSSCHMRS